MKSDLGVDQDHQYWKTYKKKLKSKRKADSTAEKEGLTIGKFDRDLYKQVTIKKPKSCSYTRFSFIRFLPTVDLIPSQGDG